MPPPPPIIRSRLHSPPFHSLILYTHTHLGTLVPKAAFEKKRPTWRFLLLGQHNANESYFVSFLSWLGARLLLPLALREKASPPLNSLGRIPPFQVPERSFRSSGKPPLCPSPPPPSGRHGSATDGACGVCALSRHPGNETSPESFLLHNALARKPKRIRTAFSPSQLLRLEHAFEKNHYVVGAERKQLAHSLSLTETQVSRANGGASTRDSPARPQPPWTGWGLHFRATPARPRKKRGLVGCQAGSCSTGNFRFQKHGAVRPKGWRF